MANLHVEYSEQDLIQLVLKDLANRFPGVELDSVNLKFLVKSKNNYRPHEWGFKVEVHTTLSITPP